MRPRLRVVPAWALVFKNQPRRRDQFWHWKHYAFRLFLWSLRLFYRGGLGCSAQGSPRGAAHIWVSSIFRCSKSIITSFLLVIYLSIYLSIYLNVTLTLEFLKTVPRATTPPARCPHEERFLKTQESEWHLAPCRGQASYSCLGAKLNKDRKHPRGMSQTRNSLQMQGIISCCLTTFHVSSA